MTRALLAAALVCAAASPTYAAEPAVVPAATLLHAVLRGDTLSIGDFDQQPRPVALARGALAMADAAGREAVRNLPEGSIVRATDVVAPRLVRRGEPVTVTLRARGFVITTAGKAMGAGGLGDLVRVVATSTNHSFDGVVEGTGAVRIASQ